MTFDIVIDPRAILDIQKAIDYYDEQQTGLGKRFETIVNKHLIALEKNPFYNVRYDDIHCLPIKKFPYMIHFTIDEERQIVSVIAVFHTSLNPGKWKKRK